MSFSSPVADLVSALGINFWVGDLSHLWPDTNVPLTDEEKGEKQA